MGRRRRKGGEEKIKNKQQGVMEETKQVELQEGEGGRSEGWRVNQIRRKQRRRRSPVMSYRKRRKRIKE